ncbi:TnsA endonuclease N-terminal domain-containing protein [Endozoicomonas sp. SCSIO W0465]|uniref:TnsA endonuclease N-terminal domain-containing protein n=1 Tax=Endozoicomonas sp. SCSIO W0465 TaxID=2918516 RepID=UPI00207596DB|nr:TnsA endonuclease N-terminal domain-containing protein [Endozoicomonas sp. SCSIO W0465]USE35247.1 TnsA endonuclease N-terminal domain-containing protein [Endozoicomonas sp. SCSIO W0465]
MPKKNVKHSPYSRSEKQITRWLEEQKRGTGHGLEYIPGLYTNEIESAKKNNFKERVSGIKACGRDMQLASHTEHRILRFFDLAKNVVEIREQFPLKRSVTLGIAEKLKIQHPSQTDYNTEKPFAIYMTTDFLVTLLDKSNQEYLVAVSVKPVSELQDKRVLEKQKIEYVYWSLRGVRFVIITDLSFKSAVSDNLELIHQSYCTMEQNEVSLPGNVNIALIEAHILSAIKSESGAITISELCKKIRLFSGYRLLCNENWPKALIYNAFRKLLAKYCQALPQEDSSLIYEISSLQYEKSQK